MAEQRSTLIIEISSEQAARNARALDRELQSIERTGNYATTSMNSMSVAARQLAGYLAGVVTVGTAIAKMDDWTNLNNRLRLVTSSQKALNVAMQDTFDIAQRSGAAWGGTATIYQKIQYNSEKLGLSQEKVAKITESISKSISNSGSSAQAASAALYQLGQSFDKSSLNGDEFVSMSENAGYLMEVFAKGLGVTRAELKEMSSQGLLTTDKMVQAIEKMSGSIEQDFGKTNFTIGQSFTQLSNAVTKFVGEAGQGSGAANAISSSLSSLANNLDTVTNIAMIGGAYWVGTYIPALYTSTMAGYGKIKQLVEQTVIQYAAVQAEKVAAAQELAGAEAKLVNLQATRAQLVEELKLELARKKKQISDQGAINSELRMGLLRQQQAAINVELTATENALAAARTRSAAAATATLGIGSRILGVMTGPVGIGISIAAVAAGYILMRDSTAEANKKLEEQTEIASRTKQELLALQGVQKKGAKADLQDAFKGQNKELKDLNYLFNAHIIELQNAYRGNLQIVEISNKVRQGMMSQEDALKRLNKLDFISPDQLKQLQKDNDLYREKLPVVQRVQEALKVFGIEAELAGNKASNSSKGFGDIAKESINTAAKVKDLSAEIQKFINDSLSSISSNSEILALRAKGITKEYAEAYVKLKESQGLLGKGQPVDMGTFAFMVKDLAIKQQIQDLDDKQTKSEKDRTKELEKQLKVLQVNEKVKANAAKYGFESIESKYGILPGLLSGIHMQESRGDANAIGPMTKYGTAKGGFQFLDDTAKRFKLTGSDVFDLGKSAEAAAKYLQILYKKFGSWDKAISAYHAGEGNVEKGTKIGPVNRQYVQNVKGYIAGTNGFEGSTKDFDTSINDLVKFLQVKQDIELQYSSGEIQRRTEHEKKLADIQSHFSGDVYTKLERQENERFANENRLAELQFDLNVRGWNWTNEQRIQNEIDTQKVTISLNKEYSDIQKQIAKEEVDAKFAYELEKSKIAKDQRLLQSTEFYMSELQLAKARYDIEKRLIAQNNEDSAENAFKTQMLELQNQVDMNRRLKDASMGWDSVQSQMNGSTGRFQVNQDRFSRMGASQNLFDTQIADVESQEQEPGADLQKLAEVREQIWAAHNQRMIDIENQYQMDSLNLQLTQAQQLTGSFANMFKGILGESSGAYKTMFAMQQGFALTQAGMNLWSSVSDAYAKEPGTVWQKVAAGAKAALDQGTFLAMIQAITPQGFATGGHITGKGTGTSDDIPIMASNGEFMMRQYAASKIGLVALNYMNQTGEIPFQREYLGMKTQFLGFTQPDLNVQKFKDGGLVGVSRLNNADVERSQFDSIRQRNTGSSQPKVTIINQTSQPVEATTQWDDNDLQVVLKEIQKQNEAMMDAKIEKRFMMSKRQGW
ncbi:tape measure protein [Acinetobacter guillouiae]|uniref:tape measure protein n=1 Tax=Acinetobacter guillouiae TaxID=106649 RepID=UPI003AF516A0